MSSNFQERFRFTFLSAEVLLEGVSVANEEVNEKYNIPLGTPFASIVMLDSCKATENNTELFHIPANAHMVVLFDSVTINDTLKNKIYNLRALVDSDKPSIKKVIDKINNQLASQRLGTKICN